MRLKRDKAVILMSKFCAGWGNKYIPMYFSYTVDGTQHKAQLKSIPAYGNPPGLSLSVLGNFKMFSGIDLNSITEWIDSVIPRCIKYMDFNDDDYDKINKQDIYLRIRQMIRAYNLDDLTSWERTFWKSTEVKWV